MRFFRICNLTRRGTNVLITRRGTNLQICTVGDYSRSGDRILKILTDSYSEFNSLSIPWVTFLILQSIWEESSVNHQREWWCIIKRETLLRIVIHNADWHDLICLQGVRANQPAENSRWLIRYFEPFMTTRPILSVFVKCESAQNFLKTSYDSLNHLLMELTCLYNSKRIVIDEENVFPKVLF